MQVSSNNYNNGHASHTASNQEYHLSWSDKAVLGNVQDALKKLGNFEFFEEHNGKLRKINVTAENFNKPGMALRILNATNQGIYVFKDRSGTVTVGKNFKQILNRAKHSQSTQTADQIYGMVHPRFAEKLRNGEFREITDSESMEISAFVCNILEELEKQKEDTQRPPLSNHSWSAVSRTQLDRVTKKQAAADKGDDSSLFVSIRKMEMGILDKTFSKEIELERHYQAIVKIDKFIKNIHINKQQQTREIIQNANETFEDSHVQLR